MKRYLPIVFTLRHKLLLVILITSALSSCLAAIALLFFQVYTLRTEFAEHTLALARITAPNTAAPIAFDDHAGMDRALAALQSKPEFVSACIYANDGGVIAHRGVLDPTTMPPTCGTYRIDGWYVHATEAITAKNESLGVLHFVTDFGPVYNASLWRFLPTTLMIVALSVTASALGMRLINKFITQRLDRLAQTAKKITEANNFKLRAPETAPDEIGILTQAFNTMLGRLESNDSELRQSNAALTSEMRERVRLQSELMESSRLAGMAEVATGVLHNVGNVLNSVNVSTGILRDQLASSQLEHLRLSAELLAAHAHDLPSFLTQDPRGRMLPEFIGDLSRQLAREHRALSEEVMRLARNIDHIKTIVHLQQNYAKETSIEEDVPAHDLVDHALLIAQTTLAKHDVQLTKDYSGTMPAIRIDRHKILQILTNVLTNAAQATQGNAPDNRKVRIGLSCTGPEKAVFVITDNGVGISEEIRPRLFTQGFTTRPDGHGFGLHSAALAARSIGAELSLHSDGPGKGSSFTITVLRPPASPSS